MRQSEALPQMYLLRRGASAVIGNCIRNRGAAATTTAATIAAKVELGAMDVSPDVLRLAVGGHTAGYGIYHLRDG